VGIEKNEVTAEEGEYKRQDHFRHRVQGKFYSSFSFFLLRLPHQLPLQETTYRQYFPIHFQGKGKAADHKRAPTFLELSIAAHTAGGLLGIKREKQTPKLCAS
jgi:hypothetical protein